MRYSDAKRGNDFDGTNMERKVSPFEDNNASYIGNYVPGSEEEKKLLRKLDMRIIVRKSLRCSSKKANSVRSRVSGYSTSWDI